MSRFRRPIAVVLLALLLQPLLRVGERECATELSVEQATSVSMPPGHQMADMADMPDMPASAPSAGTTESPTNVTPSDQHSDACTTTERCHVPDQAPCGSTSAMCLSMTSCAAPTLVAATPTLARTMRVATLRVAEPLALRLRPAAAPELPPPRA
jgi:hypothetical protein